MSYVEAKLDPARRRLFLVRRVKLHSLLLHGLLVPILFLTQAAADPAEAPKSVQADFDYQGASGVLGTFLGSCSLSGAVLAQDEPRAMDLESAGGTLVVRYTRVNVTRAPGIFLVEPEAQWTREVPVPRGFLRLETETNGLAVALPHGYARWDGAPGSIQLNVSRINASVVQAGIPTPAETVYLAEGAEKPAPARTTFPGWARRVQVEGEATLQGDASFYLRAATLEFEGGSRDLEPYEREEFGANSAVASRRTLVLTDAFLDLHAVRLRVPEGAELVCGSFVGDVTGSFVAADATGTARRGDQEVRFDRQVITLEGHFQLRENPSEAAADPGLAGSIHASGAGQIRLVGVDFASALGPGPALRPEHAGLAVLLLAAAWLLLKNLGTLVGAFYSRFGQDRVLDNASRDLIFQAVVQSPGAELSELRNLTRFHLSTVAYHVQVLKRFGLVGTLRHGRSVRVIPRDLLTRPSLARILTERDEKLAYVALESSEGPLALRTLVQRVVERFNVTTRAAYLLIDRAVARGLLARTRDEKEVIVQRAS